MHNDKVISMLGLARRAGELSMGHDMAEQAIVKKKARLLLFCSDVSPRLINELEKTVQKHNARVTVVKTAYTMDDIHYSIGYRAGVMTVNNENISNRIIQLLSQEESVNGN